MTAAEKHPLSAYSIESLSNVFEAAGFPRYRAGQVLEWLYPKRVRSFEGMRNIGAPMREYLEAHFTLMSSTLDAVNDAGDGAAKLEIRLHDSVRVEAVVIDSGKRLTLCVSCQAGCPLGCAFCATGAGGFERDLLSHEIVEQALHGAATVGQRISHVVFMGMGEPCLNLDAVFDAARIFNASYAFGIAARRITISTLGSPACIRRIAEFPLEVGLAISLHAATDRARRKLCPGAQSGIADTVKAAEEYFAKTGREVTYEYVLISGVNDSREDAAALGGLLAGKRAYVNLIPYNEVMGLPFARPTASRVIAFRRALETAGVNTEVRDSRGQGAGAACGQLRFERRSVAE